MVEELVPIILFLVIGVVTCAYFYLRYRSRQEAHLTVRHALERGQELTPEVLKAVGGDLTPGGIRDLRKGVIWLALAGALGIMAVVLDKHDLLGPAALPLMLGLAYLGLWRFAPRAEGSP